MGLKYNEKSCGVLIYRTRPTQLCSEQNIGEHATKMRQNRQKCIRLYLLLHYPGGHWDLPKGHVEQGESEHQTAARELLEETGIADFEFVNGFREEISYQYKKGRNMSTKLVVFFLARTELEKIKLSHEHHNFKWLPYGPAFNKLTFDNARNILKKGHEFLGSN